MIKLLEWLKLIFRFGNKYKVSYTLIVRPMTYDSTAKRQDELISTRVKTIRAYSSKGARDKIRNKKGYDVRNIKVSRINKY